MNKQQLKEWLHPTKKEINNFYLQQWKEPYRQTIKFYEWLDNFNVFNVTGCAKNICDLACGAGSNLYYLSQQYPHLCLTGIDISPKLINIAKKQLVIKNKNIIDKTEITYKIGDIYNLSNKLKNNYYGITMLQTLSWIPEYQKAFKQMAKLNPEWIAFSCLMNDSLVECDIKTRDYSRTDIKYGERDYYIYSNEKMKKVLYSLGYKQFNYIPFEIDIDIPKNLNNKGMGTYTVKTENQNRLQFSGGLFLNWHFGLAIKE
jgi:SAM-dependent methyltransferase